MADAQTAQTEPDFEVAPEEPEFEVSPQAEEREIEPPTRSPFSLFPSLETQVQVSAESGAEIAEERRRVKTQSLIMHLGEGYDPDETFDGNFFTIADTARSLRLADKQRKFLREYPDGSLISVMTPNGPVVLARKSRGDRFQEIPFLPEIAGAVGSETGVLGILGSLVGPAGTLAGTTIGAFLQDEVEKERGFGPSFGVSGAVREGVVAGSIDVATRGIGRVLFGPRNPPSIAEALADAVQASRELGLEPLAIGQVGGPFQRGMFRQVGATSPRVERKLTAQQESLKDALENEATKLPPAGTTEADMIAVTNKQLADLDKTLTLPNLRRVEGGQALDRGIRNWKNSTKHVRDRLYANALVLSDDVVFTLNPAQEVATDIARGVLARARTGRGAIRLTEQPAGKLADVVSDLIRMNPRVTKFSAVGNEWTAFEQIKTLRTRLFDLKQSDDPMVRREATRLWRALTQVMDNPISGDPSFTSAYRTASMFNRLREDTLNKAIVGKILRTESPEDIARLLMQPGQATELATLRDLIQPQNWQDFRTAFAQDVIHSPTANQGLSRMNRFEALDPDGFALLVKPTEKAKINTFLREKARLEASPIVKDIARSYTETERTIRLAKRGSAGELEKAVTAAGGAGSDFAMRARAGIYKDILDNSMVTTPQGVRVIDPNRLIANIEGWQKTGKVDFLFRRGDWRRLELYRKYAAPVSETADIGGAMMAGGLRQEAVQAPITTIYGDAKRVGKRLVRPLVSNNLSAWMLSRPASASRILLAKGDFRSVVEHVALGLMITNRRLEEQRPENVPPLTEQLEAQPEDEFEVESDEEASLEGLLKQGFKFLGLSEDGKRVITDGEQEFIEE